MHVLMRNKKVGLGLAVTSLLLMAGTTFAASSVVYDLQLGGDNHAASIKAGTYVYFTPGSSADDQEFMAGSQVTWSATLTASGTQSSGPGAGSAIKGAANFVFDLELRQGSESGPIVASPVFYSSIHDGGSECIPAGGTIPEGFCPPCLAGAAFAFSFNVWSYGPGRVVEPPWRGSGGNVCTGYPNLPAGGGPNMNVCLYPTVENGKLLGMGAGYQQWLRTSGPTWSQEGVGLVSGGLGIGPVVEGQIDTTSLTPGTYYLKLIPKSGTNVLRGDINLSVAQNAFATTAEQLTGSVRRFVVTAPQCTSNEQCDDGLFCNGAEVCNGGVCEPGSNPCASPLLCDEDNDECVECLTDNDCSTGYVCTDGECVASTPPTLVSASLAIEHGSGQYHSLDLPIGAASTKTEPRQNPNAPYWIIKLTFSEPMEAIDGDVELADEVVISQGDGGAYFISDTELEIFLISIPANQTCLSITLSGLRSSLTGLSLTGDNDVHVGALYGDANRNKTVNTQDLSRVKSQLFQAVTDANADCDVNCSNTINTVDLSVVKANLFKSVACP